MSEKSDEYDGEDRRERKAQGLGIRDAIQIATILGGGFLLWGNLSADMAIIKHSQTTQTETNQSIRRDIGEVRTEQKEQAQAIRRVEDKVNRARL